MNAYNLVSIGMPVYQGSESIEIAILSLLNQTYINFELIISDNGSTDNTKNICQKYALQDSRIRFIHHNTNMGAAKNFAFVLGEAKGKYFMWAAHDDCWSVDFIECNYSFLESNNEYVASICPVRFSKSVFNVNVMGDQQYTGNVDENIKDFVSRWHANCVFYSLINTDVLKKCKYNGMDFLGSDWLISLHLLLNGKINRCEEGFMLRGNEGFSNSKDILLHYRINWIHYFFPIYELFKEILLISTNFNIKYKILLLFYLLKLNLQINFKSITSFFFKYVKYS